MRKAFAGARDWLRRHRAVRIALVALGSLAVIALIADRALDRPLRGIVERRMNRNLNGYSVRVGHADFQVIGLALVLERVVMSQDAHPDPPVLRLPYLRMSVHWIDLLVAHVVADATFRSPAIHVDLAQLMEENRDEVPVSRRGWQRALQAAYPLKINELKVTNATIVYQDDDASKALELSQVHMRARNIRNIRSRDRTYPSTFHAEGRVFEVGHAVVDGRADALAEPFPGIKGTLDMQRVELSYFQPLAGRMGLTVKKGFLDARGAVEWAPNIQTVDFASVDIREASVDYQSGSGPTPQARAAGKRISELAKTSLNNPESRYRVERLTIADGTLGVVNKVQDPPYRLEFSQLDVEVTNVSSRAEDGPARAMLHGAFMDTGAMKADATFYPEGDQANVEVKLEIVDTPLKSLNNLLQARGKFDVSEGTFELYSEVRVRNGAVEGYVKPLFKNVEVYESEQDKHKNIFRQAYEGLVGGAAKLLQNRRGQVATVTSLNGPLDDPKANALQALRGLLKNAFVKAILPGFRNEIFQREPYKFRAAMKKENDKGKDETVNR